LSTQPRKWTRLGFASLVAVLAVISSLFSLMAYAKKDVSVEVDEKLRSVSPLIAERRVTDLRSHIQLMFESPHAVESDPRTPAGRAKEANGNYCFACHGESFEHFFRVGDDVSATTVNNTCLGCHSGGDRMHWSGGPHEVNDMACVDCHSMHSKNERLLRTSSQLDLCSSCHLERRSDFNRPFHHPVKEGQMVCTDCHNPHGTTSPTLLRGSDVNETCYSCHAEHRGPFLWDHEPVREACINCHNPHGSVNPAMLEARPAQLCQTCHITDSGHPGELMDHRASARPSFGEAMQVGKGCVNCHSQVHGSNHPGGMFFRK